MYHLPKQFEPAQLGQQLGSFGQAGYPSRNEINSLKICFESVVVSSWAAGQHHLWGIGQLGSTYCKALGSWAAQIVRVGQLGSTYCKANEQLGSTNCEGWAAWAVPFMKSWAAGQHKLWGLGSWAAHTVRRWAAGQHPLILTRIWTVFQEFWFR